MVEHGSSNSHAIITAEPRQESLCELAEGLPLCSRYSGRCTPMKGLEYLAVFFVVRSRTSLERLSHDLCLKKSCGNEATTMLIKDSDWLILVNDLSRVIKIYINVCVL